MSRHPDPTRRAFLLGACAGAGAAGLAFGIPLAWQAYRPAAAEPVPAAAGPDGMPGRFPGRVVEVRHPGSVSPENVIDRAAVATMMERGLCSLTGADHFSEAWSSFFEKDDVVGIKVNPVGNAPRGGAAVAAISSPAVLLEVVRGLKSAGVAARNIIVFERYASEFVGAGYADVLSANEMSDVRWFAASAGYSSTQVEIDGVARRSDYSPELLQHVVGYDPDAYVSMGYCAPEHDPKDDRRFRSHLTLVVSRLVNKFVTLPVFKDHRSAGVTLALKNLSHGLNNNVARSHISGIAHGWPGSPGADLTGPNQWNTFIPTAVNQQATRQKATLRILDGLIGVYEGGPGPWNRTWATWPCRTLFFATDPVALDHVGWDVLDTKRQSEGWPHVADMGRSRFPRPVTAAASAACVTCPGPAAWTLAAAGRRVVGGSVSEVFERRQPEHIYLAGTLGLGRFDQSEITHVRVNVPV